MSTPRLARCKLWLAPHDPYAGWIQEALFMTGLHVERLDPGNPGPCDVLILAGHHQVSAAESRLVERLVEAGAVVVALGSTWGLRELFPLTPHAGSPRFGRGQLKISPAAHALTGLNDFPSEPLPFVGGTRLSPGAGKVLAATPDGLPLVLDCEGHWLFVPHLGQTVAAFCGGRAVGGEHLGPDDGSAELMPGEPRAEQAINLDFLQDRTALAGAPAAFLRPVVDQLLDLFTCIVLQATESAGARAVMVWRWPHNSSSVAGVTFEADIATGETLRRAAGLATKLGFSPSWMVPPPGLPQDVVRTFRKLGHDFGLLFRPDRAEPGDDQVKTQANQIARAMAESNLAGMSVLEGGWWGKNAPYRAAVGAGLPAVSSRGGQQPGTSGFAFGTGRIGCPVECGQALAVTEVPRVAFAPGQVTPQAVTEALVSQAATHQGLMHVVVRLSQLVDDGQEAGLIRVMTTAKVQGMQLYSPLSLGGFELARRRLRLQVDDHRVRMVSEQPMTGLTLLIAGTDWPLETAGRRYAAAPVTRFGRTFSAATLDLERNQPAEIRSTATIAA